MSVFKFAVEFVFNSYLKKKMFTGKVARYLNIDLMCGAAVGINRAGIVSKS